VLKAMGLTVSPPFRLMMVKIAKEKFEPLVPNEDSKGRPVSRPWAECLTLPFWRKERADQTDRITAVALNFEMKGRGLRLMATNEHIN
jgi:hypothetical protein